MKRSAPADSTPSTTAPLDPVLTWPELRAVIKLSRPQVWRLRQANQFPAPIKLSKNRIGWRQSDVRAWLASRPAA